MRACVSIRASNGCARSPMRQELEARIGSAFGLPTTIYVVLADGRRSGRAARDERAADAPAQDRAARRSACRRPRGSCPRTAAQARTTARIAQSGLSVAAVRSSLDQAATRRRLPSWRVRAVCRSSARAARHLAAIAVRGLRRPRNGRPDRAVHRARRGPMAARDLSCCRRTMRRSRGSRRSWTAWIRGRP